ncbi:helix-turn-helix domain-containing protein [Amycolatopsis roodepoortensis]|uniref:helix-turn-helix domain-containing protein n=1 Tax=Amycolatopsis roodepoortensis TaxID=700274 RepID=UPI0027D89963|nr:hypothetical protein [Amycolatopsis roodepoortensis]
MADEDRGDPRGNLAQKLRHLHWTQRGLGNQMLSYEDIATGVTRATGRKCGETYIEKLFTGQPVRHPDPERLEAILTQFGKTPADLEDRGDPHGTFGQRLQHLRYQYGQERGKPLIHEEIAEHVRRYTGRSCRAEYIGQLLNDREPNGLAKDKIEALAAFFKVSPAYFFDDEKSRADQQKLEAQDALLSALQELREVGGDFAAAFRQPNPGQAMSPQDMLQLATEIRAYVGALREQGSEPHA